MTPERMSAVGLITFLPAYFGAEPCTASKIATSEPRFADGAKPRPPTSAEVRSLRMSPFMFVVTITSNCSGRLTSWWAQLSTMMCCASMSGYSGATSSNVRLSVPSVSFMMFDLVAQWTVVRPSARANSKREPDDLLAALARDELEALRDAGRLHVLDARVEVLDVLADDDEVDAAARVRRGDARQLAGGADVAVRLEQLAERDVRALLAEADRRLERPLEDDARLADRLDRVLRNARGEALHEHARAGLPHLPLDGRARPPR